MHSSARQYEEGAGLSLANSIRVEESAAEIFNFGDLFFSASIVASTVILAFLFTQTTTFQSGPFQYSALPKL